MTQEQLQLMECLRAYMTGRAPDRVILQEKQQWQSLYRLAAVHKMTAVVYQILGQMPEFCREMPELKAMWKQSAFCQVAAQTAKTRRIVEIAQQLDQAQIPYAVVKGVICRQLYTQPDLRPSGDEDVLIRGEDRQKCQEILQSMGLSHMQGMAEEDVTHWMDHGTGLHIELHQALVPADWEMAKVLNPYFSRNLADGIRIPVDGAVIRTLNPTAHFVFLVAHALKHFISGGVGVRSVGDILAFAEVYSDVIDHRQVREMVTQIRGWEFFQQILAIGGAYLDIIPEKLGWERTAPADFEPMLMDMLEAGIYGQATRDRKHSASMLVQQAQGKKKSSLRTAIFPAASSLRGRYPVLKKWPLLLPFVWIHRIGCYAAEVFHSKGRGNSPTQAMALGRQRQALMERYGIFTRKHSR